jgi:tetratricopeptide (TPR) repeat protein
MNDCKIKTYIKTALFLFGMLCIPAFMQESFAQDTKDSSGVISTQMKKIINELGYSEKIADDFVKMVFSWMDADDKPLIWAWKTKLDEARTGFDEKKLTIEAYSDAQAGIAKEINTTILRKIKGDGNPEFYSLSNVLKRRRAQCLGHSQTFYVIAQAIGLDVAAVNVLQCSDHYKDLNTADGHVACIVRLPDKRGMIADLAYTSAPFEIDKTYEINGKKWKLKDASNSAKVHSKFDVLDFNGILAYLHNNRGNSLYRKQEYQKALADYNKAAELNPEFALMYNNRGVTYTCVGEQKKAMADYNKAIELDPGFFVPYYNRGNLYGASNENDKAVEDYTRALSLNPRYADAYNNRGTIYYSTAKYDKAIEDYSKAVENNPSFAVAWCNLGLAYRVKGDYENTIKSCTKAIELDPKNGFAYYNRGVAYAATGKSGEAANDFLQTLKLDPSLKEKVIENAQKYGIGLD